MMESYTEQHPVPAMTLDSLIEAIRNTWAQCFGHLPENQRPKRGLFYLKKGDKNPKKVFTATAQKSSVIKDKSSTPSYSQQQKPAYTSKDKGKGRADETPGSSASKSSNNKKCPNRRAPCKPHAHHALVDSNDNDDHRFEIAHPTLVPTPLLD
jgi:hypothetical protein